VRLVRHQARTIPLAPSRHVSRAHTALSSGLPRRKSPRAKRKFSFSFLIQGFARKIYIETFLRASANYPEISVNPFIAIKKAMPTNAGALAAGVPLPLRWPSHLSPASRTGYINGPVARRPSTNPNTGEPCLLDKLDAAGLTVQEYCSKITSGATSGSALPSPHMLPSVTRHPCADAETLMGVSTTAAAMLCTTGTTKSHPGRTGELRTLGPDGRPGGLRPLFCHTLPHHLPPAPQDQCLRVRCRPGPRGSPTIGSTPRL